MLCLLLSAGCSSPPPTLEWEFTGGPYAQNVSTLFADGKNPDVLYAALTTGHVVVSSDRGRSWSEHALIAPNTHVYKFVQHPEEVSRIYAATSAGLFASTDGGASWRLVRITADSDPWPITALGIDPWRPNTVYAGIKSRGIYKSNDHGATWVASNGGLTPANLAGATVTDIKIDQGYPDVVWAGLSTVGLIKSTDAGANWTKHTERFAATGSYPTAISLSLSSHGTLCIGMNGGDIYKSDNGGFSWSPTRTVTAYGPVNSLVIHPGQTEMLYAASASGVAVSSDFGTTWRELPSPNIATSLVVAHDKSAPDLFIHGAGIGVQRSTDSGSTWRPVDAGLGGSTVSFITSNSTHRVFAAVENSLFYFSASAGSWISISDGLVGGTITSVAFDKDSAGVIYTATSSGLYKSNNDGTQWHSPTSHLRGIHVQFFDSHPSIGTRCFATTGTGFFVSTNRGYGWVTTKPPSARHSIHSMTYNPRNAGIIHAATANSAVIITNDGGLNWEPARYGMIENDVLAVSLDPEDLNVCYAWTSGGDGFRSKNRGLEWDRYAPPWSRGSRVLISVDRYTPSDVVALIDNARLYYTINGGATWFPIDMNSPGGSMTAIHWNKSTNTLYAGIKDRGVYRLRLEMLMKKISGA